MGLPGAGKSYLSKLLSEKLSAEWLNADALRKQYDDWDFSTEGRIRQSKRMRLHADMSMKKYVIADFVSPLSEMRNIYEADWIIWMDTIDQGRFADTNKAFERPVNYDYRITEQCGEKWADQIARDIIEEKRKPIFDWKKETVQMLGRWQPWHEGHRALFERCIQKTGQVVIQIRDCQGWNNSNPFAIEEVKNFIRRDLDTSYQGQYEIQVVPNIVNITYGRDVGYKIEQEKFDQSIESISATQIRKQMNVNDRI